jgi:MFS family permease
LYFLGFSAAQIPAGLLLDRFGPRRVVAGLLLIASAGALMFGIAGGLGFMLAGRFLIGVGVSACLGGAFKATVQHFSADRLTFVNGIVMAIGGIGGIAVGAPLSWLLSLTDWRTISIGLAVMTAASAGAVFLFAPAEPDIRVRGGLGEQLAGTGLVLRSPLFWKVATFSGLTQSVFYAMQSLWVGAFLRDVTYAGQSANVVVARAASLVSVLGAAFIAGNVCFGALARVAERNGMSVYLFSGITMSLFVIVQLVIATGIPAPEPVLWAAYGALGGTGILTYSVLAKQFPPHMIGRINTSFTLVMFLGIFVLQTTIGVVLGHWPTNEGHYPVAAHRCVWIALIALQAAAAVYYFVPGRSARSATGVRANETAVE